SVIKLKNLKYLDLSGCSIKSIPEEIFEIKSLEELYLDGNQIQEIPISITKLVNLKILSLKKNLLKEPPLGLEQLKNLEFVGLHANHLKELGIPQHVVKKYLEGIPEELPVVERNFISKILAMAGKKWSVELESPRFIIENGHLVEFYVEKTLIYIMPEEFEFLEHLRKFRIEISSWNRYYGLKYPILKYPRKLLELEMKKLEKFNIPIEEKKTLVLMKQTIPNMKIIEINEDWDNTDFNELNCNICIHDGHIKLIKFIEYDDYFTYGIHPSIKNLKNLEVLILRNNYIHEIPDEICELRNLKHLDFYGNPIDKLPENIGNLVNIETLILSKTDINHFPDSFKKLNSIKYFRAAESKLLEIPDNIIPINLEKFMKYTIPDQERKALSALSIISTDYYGSNLENVESVSFSEFDGEFQ
ncbi:MAG: leucine-rich repeat domain-containing protein, partial [Candidatus Helarchaeota archaeon]